MQRTLAINLMGVLFSYLQSKVIINYNGCTYIDKEKTPYT